MKIVPTALLGAALFSLNSCVAAWMTQTGKSETIPRTRSEAVSTYGQPVISRKLAKDSPVQNDLRWTTPDGSKRRTGGIRSYEIYEYKGLMKDKEFGNSAAMANALTLGTSEAIAIPSAIVNRAAGVTKTHRFFAGYEGSDQIVIFRRIEKNTRFATLLEKYPAPVDR
ncbi:hypothetical protein JIN84_21110 [Luteolibacter yonseiensis]|uniref:Lipoprotein n=1 Tax=Luteolibacter yonseiensis TaxID=1144680 RepID=A0A934VDK9_9BACT|nr:hypothetical protein [Luteolibacter yonseiensis]MBK1818136.1 hypothetical protein [Luteolibacter yonseiensis]